MTDPRYPIGRFEPPATYDDTFREQSIAHIAHLPTAMRAAVAGLNDAQLDTPYRDGGWTIRQVVHHVPDSHMHAYIRTKFALAEHEPSVKAYDEARWAISRMPRPGLWMSRSGFSMACTTLGDAPALVRPSGFQPRLVSPREWAHDGRPYAGAVQLALATPHRTYHFGEGEARLVGYRG